MKTLQISEANALQAYRNADTGGKTLLTNLFGKQVFNQKITDRVKTYEDACAVLDISPESALPYLTDAPGDISAINAFAKLSIIAKALNEGWAPDWINGNQYKYYPYFRNTGSGFSFAYCDYYYQYSAVGSHLCFSSSELAEYAGQQFEALYNDYMSL